MAKNIPQIKQQFFDENGDPLVGGKIWTYEANSTTPKATYTDRAGGTENANPVILNSAGEGEIWCSAGLYKFVIMDSNDQTLNTINEIRVEPVDGSDEAAAASAAAAAISAAAALVSENNAETAETNAETAETNAELAESNAAASASTATTQAGNASTSASNASTSASTATTQAGIATTKAGEANASAIAAAASALAADASADAAAISEVNSAANASATATHIADTVDAHLGTAIGNTPSGNLAATTVQAALNELQTDVDSRATASDLSSHTGNTSNPHSVTASQIGLGNVDNTSDATKNAAAVVLTNKDIDGGTAADTKRITVPKNTKANLDALTRKEGTLVYATDQSKMYVDTGSALVAVGSGGGGSSLDWIEDALAPVASFEYSQRVYAFADGETQYLYAAVRVPSTYTAGGQINLRGLFYGNATANTVLMQTVATLIRTGTDAVSSTTNQRTSTNSAVTLATTANRPNAFICDLTSSTGQINSVSVSAGDLILVRLTRDTATDTATVDAMFPPYSSEVTFT